MELPSRPLDDRTIPPGESADIRRRIAALPGSKDLRSVIACAFDHRTRMLPFLLADTHMVPAGVRAIGSAMLDSGLQRTRIVLQQWNRNFQPSCATLDGEVPDLLLISSMSLHTAPCLEMIRDACRIAPERRPLIIVGGSICMYEPWVPISDPALKGARADVSISGETYILMHLLERLLAERSAGEPLRRVFYRLRDEGSLDAVPGLVYPQGEPDGPAESLVDTGVQRLVADLDTEAWPELGYSILEAPSRGRGLASQPLPEDRVARRSPLSTLVLTIGCKFRCPYCPIPAYNQRLYRAKSGERIAEEIRRLHERYGLRQFFGADDNFFNDHQRTIAICETLAKATTGGQPLRHRCRIATEVTVHDTLAMREHLPLVRKAGVRALWIGVEDLTGKLVKKGQTPDSTAEAFRLLRKQGIAPMPMMMHHDGQPLVSRGNYDGLLNQVQLLKQAGAAGLQVLMITPSAGSKLYCETYESGLVFDSVAGRKVEPSMTDGNYVIASHDPQPWRKQLNMLAAYLLFYNPLRLLRILTKWRNRQLFLDAFMQLWGMWGWSHTLRRTVGWAVRLMLGPIRRRTSVPTAAVPIHSPAGADADHDPLRNPPEPSCTQASQTDTALVEPTLPH